VSTRVSRASKVAEKMKDLIRSGREGYVIYYDVQFFA